MSPCGQLERYINGDKMTISTRYHSLCTLEDQWSNKTEHVPADSLFTSNKRIFTILTVKYNILTFRMPFVCNKSGVVRTIDVSTSLSRL